MPPPQRNKAFLREYQPPSSWARVAWGGAPLDLHDRRCYFDLFWYNSLKLWRSECHEVQIHDVQICERSDKQIYATFVSWNSRSNHCNITRRRHLQVAWFCMDSRKMFEDHLGSDQYSQVSSCFAFFFCGNHKRWVDIICKHHLGSMEIRHSSGVIWRHGNGVKISNWTIDIWSNYSHSDLTRVLGPQKVALAREILYFSTIQVGETL